MPQSDVILGKCYQLRIPSCKRKRFRLQNELYVNLLLTYLFCSLIQNPLLLNKYAAPGTNVQGQTNIYSQIRIITHMLCLIPQRNVTL